MRDSTRLRLETITARHAKRIAGTQEEADRAAAEAAFLRSFDRVRAELLRPAMDEIGVELERAGHGYRVELASEPPRIELHLRIAGGRRSTKDLIRFFAAKGEVVAEIEFLRSPMELRRFRGLDELTPDVIEQVLIEGVEQAFASNSG